MNKAPFLPSMYAPDSPEEINRAQREGRQEPLLEGVGRGYLPLSVRQTADHYVVVDGHGSFYAKTYSSIDANITAAWPDLLKVAHALRKLCGRQANILSTATDAERRKFISDVYALVNGDGNVAIAKAIGAAS